MIKILLLSMLLLASADALATGATEKIVVGKKKKKKPQPKASPKLSKEEIKESKRLTAKYRKLERLRINKEARMAEWRKDKTPLYTLPPREIEEPKEKQAAFEIEFTVISECDLESSGDVLHDSFNQLMFLNGARKR